MNSPIARSSENSPSVRGALLHGTWRRFRSAVAMAAVSALFFTFFPAIARSAAPDTSNKAQPRDIVIQGKLQCSLKRQVLMPFKGVITGLKVQPGQPVKKGDVLARYRIAPETVLQLKRQISRQPIKEMELSLANLNKTLSSLEIKRTEARSLLKEQMATEQGLEAIEKEIQYHQEARAVTQEKLKTESRLLQDSIAQTKELLGGSLKPVESGEEASLVAPISGHVIAIQSDIRNGVELGPGTPAFVVGVIDPIMMRAQIHESDIVHIAVGDKAEVTLESLPDRVLEGVISRVSWTPLVPGVEQPSYYEIELTLPNPNLLLREGFKGQVTFHRVATR